jgi:hypothetical protein
MRSTVTVGFTFHKKIYKETVVISLGGALMQGTICAMSEMLRIS